MNADEKSFAGCFLFTLMLGLIAWGFVGWMIYEIVTWITSK